MEPLVRNTPFQGHLAGRILSSLTWYPQEISQGNSLKASNTALSHAFIKPQPSILDPSRFRETKKIDRPILPHTASTYTISISYIFQEILLNNYDIIRVVSINICIFIKNTRNKINIKKNRRKNFEIDMAFSHINPNLPHCY